MAWIKHKDTIYNLNLFYTISFDDKNKDITLSKDDYNHEIIFCKTKEEYQSVREKIDMALFGQIFPMDY